jgi:hypothetical protein
MLNKTEVEAPDCDARLKNQARMWGNSVGTEQRE